MRNKQHIVNDMLLPYKIVDTVEVNNSVIVRVETDIDHNLNRNIFSFTKSGLLKWQVQESMYGLEQDNPFVGMTISSHGKSFVYDWSGIHYVLDISNGCITPYYFTK